MKKLLPHDTVFPLTLSNLSKKSKKRKAKEKEKCEISNQIYHAT